MFITPAYAQAGGGGDAFASFLPIILIFVVFYFLLIRPQQKKQKQHKAMLDALKKLDDASGEVTEGLDQLASAIKARHQTGRAAA